VVFHLIIIMVLMAVVFIGGFFVTMRSWELHLIPLIIVAVCVCVCKYYFENCVFNILFFFNSLSDVE
jgi:uncharacterized membrane protein YhfC